MREYWESFGIEGRRCIKTDNDYREFAIYVLSQSSLEQDGAKYLRKKNPDIARLRQMLCAAWRQSKAGLRHRVDGKSAQAFADILAAAGIPCKRSDVENARKPFIPNICPSTPAVKAALSELLSILPTLDSNSILSSGQGIDLIETLDTLRPYHPMA